MFPSRFLHPKVRFESAPPDKTIYTEEELVELDDSDNLKKNEKEIGVEKRQFMCIVHESNIDGEIYLFPKCHTFYCVKCAKVLKIKGENCWVCKTEINLK